MTNMSLDENTARTDKLIEECRVMWPSIKFGSEETSELEKEYYRKQWEIQELLDAFSPF
jgi:hypothetical protein